MQVLQYGMEEPSKACVAEGQPTWEERVLPSAHVVAECTRRHCAESCEAVTVGRRLPTHSHGCPEQEGLGSRLVWLPQWPCRGSNGSKAHHTAAVETTLKSRCNDTQMLRVSPSDFRHPKLPVPTPLLCISAQFLTGWCQVPGQSAWLSVPLLVPWEAQVCHKTPGPCPWTVPALCFQSWQYLGAKLLKPPVRLSAFQIN